MKKNNAAGKNKEVIRWDFIANSPGELAKIGMHIMVATV
jgi:hypothetical protein